MAFVVEEDIPFDPGDIGLFCADRVPFAADSLAHQVEQFCGAFITFHSCVRENIVYTRK